MDNVEDVRKKFEELISSSKVKFIMNLIGNSNVGLKTMLQYIPEILVILAKDVKGLQILKDTKIYDYFTSTK